MLEIKPHDTRQFGIMAGNDGYRGWIQGYRLVVQGLAFPQPVPIAAFWRPNNECEAHIASQALETGALKVTDVLLGDETFGKGAFPQRYAEAGGWVSRAAANYRKNVGRGKTIFTLIGRKPLNCSFNASSKRQT